MESHYNIKILQKYGLELTAEQLDKNAKKTVVVGMSGGVDSSVSALLIKMMGYHTIGIFMRNWEETHEDDSCQAEADYQDVIKVCEKIDIPYYSVNFSQEYKHFVFDHFLSEYEKGHTPNPDILCNREIKFRVFYDKAKDFGADYLATGHYCQVRQSGDQTFLQKGFDQAKDQSYFLHAVKEDILKNVLFPIGHLPKAKVRQCAVEFDLATSEKKDSTGICFIGERNFKDFLSQYLKSQMGTFVHLESNKVLGKHSGMCFYTIGQRKGLGLGGPGGPWFVARKEPSSNTLYVVEGENHSALYADELVANELTWITKKVNFPFKCHAKIRYRQKDQACTVRENPKGEGLQVVFDDPQRAISIGQSVVFYQGDTCLGGAVIQECGPSYYELKKSIPITSDH